MALPTSYLITTKNVEPFFNSLITAQAPERVNKKFLDSLDFKSSNDRLFMPMLRVLGFTDESSVPTQRYFDFLDQSKSKKIMAGAVKEAYQDLFAVKVNANDMTIEEVKNKFRTLTQGQKSEKVLGLMANTFKSLAEYADWSEAKQPKEKKLLPSPEEEEMTGAGKDNVVEKSPQDRAGEAQFHYNIQIHLPETRDVAVYDAIFKSLKDHLL